MIERRTGHDAVEGGQTERTGEPRRHGVQHHRAVAVEHALGVAGGAGGVAEHRTSVLVELRPGERLFDGDQLLVAHHPFEAGRRLRGQFDEMPDIAQPRPQTGDAGGEAAVEQQHLAAGMVDGVHDLLIRQPRIGGVQHRADAGYGEEQFVMTMGVPGQRRHAVAGADAQRTQHTGSLRGAVRKAGVVVPPEGFIDQPRDDFAVAMGTGGVGEDAADQQGGVLHQTWLHVSYLYLVFIVDVPVEETAFYRHGSSFGRLRHAGGAAVLSQILRGCGR